MEETFDRLIYQRGNKTKEARSIDLKVPNDMTCHEFKIICIRMAHTLGYHEENIKETFGVIEDVNKDVDKQQIKLLFD